MCAKVEFKEFIISCLAQFVSPTFFFSFAEEDLDLRILPAVNTNKRPSTEHTEATVAKKLKTEKFDA